VAPQLSSPPTPHGPWVDVHAHPGRCFLGGLAPDNGFVQILGGDGTDAALAEIGHAGMAAVSFATVSDLLVLGPGDDGGLVAARPFAPGKAYADHLRQLRALAEVGSRPGTTIVRTVADIHEAHHSRSTALFLTCEGADFVEGDLARVADAYDAGVRSITLVHYRVNDCGDIQTAPPEHGGLTDAGRALVAEMNRLGMVIDAAHATAATTMGILECSTDPIMISHSHLRSPGREHPRLLGLDHAQAVAQAGGLIGAWPAGVTSTSFDDFADEVLRLVDSIGIDQVAIGTDMDANFRPVMTAYDQFAALADALGQRGLDATEVDRVLGGNAVDLIGQVCGRDPEPGQPA